MEKSIKTQFKRNDVIYADELVSLIKNEEFTSFKYARNMAERIDTIIEVSNFNLNVFEHTNGQVMDVFKDTVEYEFDREIVMLDSTFDSSEKNATDISKEAKRCENMVLSAIPRIYKTLNNPTQPEGIYFCKELRKKVFNKFKEPTNRRKYLEFAGILNTESSEDFNPKFEEIDSMFNSDGIELDESFEGHFNWDNYPTWKILLENLTNPEKNITHYQTGKQEKICAFEHFVKWLSIISTKNIKTGILPIFVSATPGAGKGIMQKEFFSWLFSDDYCTPITVKQLSTGFNSMIKDKLFWMFDEGQVDKSQQNVVAGALKNIITESKIISEAKGKDAENSENFSNGIVACNVLAIPLDTDDRRTFIMETHHLSLEERVINEFNYESIQFFIEELIEQRDEFFKALFTFNFNHSEVLAKPVITEAKRKMMYATNTMASNVISIIRKRNISELKQFFAGEVEGDDQIKLLRLCEEVKNGFLTNDSTSFIYDMLRNEKDKKMTKKLYWDKNLEATVTRKYKKLDGKTSSQQIRIINPSVFNKKGFQDYMACKTATVQELDELRRNEEAETEIPDFLRIDIDNEVKEF